MKINAKRKYKFLEILLVNHVDQTKKTPPFESKTHPSRGNSRQKQTAILLWGLTILYCLFIFCLSSLEGEEVEESSAGSAVFFLEEESDKLEHFLLYFGLGCLAYGAFRKSLPLNPCLSSVVDQLGNLFASVFKKERMDGNSSLRYGLVGITFLFVVLYGLSDEIHQYFVPGRSATFLDLVVDAVGGLTATFFMHCFIRKRKERKFHRAH